MYTTVKLIKIEENRPVARETDREFFYILQRGVLLALKDDGRLTQTQFWNAEKKLQDQRKAMIFSQNEEGGSL